LPAADLLERFAVAEDRKAGILKVPWSYPEGVNEMKRQFVVLAVVVFGVTCIGAAKDPETATIVSEKSVECGTKNQGKKKSTEVLCQQYTVRTATTEYQIRQEKPADRAIIPANTAIEFTLNKDKMKFKANGKSYEYLVVGTSAVSAETK
jgi:hypothetical protein